jgi:hypothetical protein
MHGKDFYPKLEKSEVQIYVMDCHWDTWNEGNLIMCFIKKIKKERLV